MTGLDTAIREAIDRAGARDAETRQRVYRSARAALEKSIARRPDLDEATADQQRSRFDAIIAEIEAEKATTEVPVSPSAPLNAEPWAASQADPSSAVPSVSVDKGRDDVGSDAADVPLLDAGEVREPAPDAAAPVPDLKAELTGEDGDDTPPAAMFKGIGAEVRADNRPSRKAERQAQKRERRQARRSRPARRSARLWSTLFLLVSVLVFGALALWFLNVTGLVGDSTTIAGTANSFRKFDAASAGGNSDLMTEDGFGGAWSPIYVPGKSDTAQAGSSAKIEPVANERGKALRLTSSAADANGDIRIAVPAHLLAGMAGTSSIIALNVRAVDGKPTQIAVECDFGPLGHCGRRRFDVAVEMTDVVFRVDLSKAAPGGDGSILINTDIDGQGRSIDLFAVGVRRGS